jgi:Molybdopterin-guanine dinucleotide biosynthesis protein A
MTDYSAIILAGGKSSRMGQKKGSLLFRGKPFIEIIFDKLSDIGISEIMISGYEHNYNGSIYVEDKYRGKGPLAGIHAGLYRSGYEHMLVITEDAPFVPSNYIEQLIEIHKRGLSPVTAASCEGRLQQLLGIYDKSLAPICETILEGDRPTVMSLIDKVGCQTVPFNGDEILIRGCNTPEEYEEMIQKNNKIENNISV